MNRINEIGDTPKGQYMLGQVYARANKRLSDLTDAWTKQMPKKKYYTAAEYYPNGTKKYEDIMHDAKTEAECPPNRKVNLKPVVYNDKGYETTNFGLGARDYEKTHRTNESKQYTNMNKILVKLTESDIHNIVKESVNRVLNERTYQEAMEEEYNEYKNYVMNLYNHLLDAKKFLEGYEHDGLWRFDAKWIYPAVVDAIYKIKEHVEDD